MGVAYVAEKCKHSATLEEEREGGGKEGGGREGGGKRGREEGR